MVDAETWSIWKLDGAYINGLNEVLCVFWHNTRVTTYFFFLAYIFRVTRTRIPSWYEKKLGLQVFWSVLFLSWFTSSLVYHCAQETDTWFARFSTFAVRNFTCNSYSGKRKKNSGLLVRALPIFWCYLFFYRFRGISFLNYFENFRFCRTLVVGWTEALWYLTWKPSVKNKTMLQIQKDPLYSDRNYRNFWSTVNVVIVKNRLL